ncbi:MAG: 3-dehydroquinate synthase II [Methanomicrobiales archaeon]|nr:3-dehydroquinate synthase II [Methanomicrobiales archaeon]
MKSFWVDIRPWDKRLVTAAIESGADAIIAEDAAKVHELGRVMVISPDGDLVPGRDIFEVEVMDGESEARAVALSERGPVIVSTSNWKIIPLENLVARSDRIVARVRDADEARVVLSVLEKGVHGVLLETKDPSEIRRTASLLQEESLHVDLEEFEIKEIKNVGMGDRVCVDTCHMMADGEGMLVGDTSSGFLLVHAETLVNPYVEPRPFRVNAGGVHAYCLTPSGRTSYLSELKAGSDVLVVDREGRGREAIVGRVKIERRPLIHIKADGIHGSASLIVQNAETIRLVSAEGVPVSVVALKAGDRILGCSSSPGRHFGIQVRESIIEK